MKPGDLEYQSLVEQKREEIRGHKVTHMNEEETAREIASTTEGVFEYSEYIYQPTMQGTNAIIETTSGPDLKLTVLQDGSIEGGPVPRKRGRPKGSRNKPKEKA